jgi:hypothetical protein
MWYLPFSMCGRNRFTIGASYRTPQEKGKIFVSQNFSAFKKGRGDAALRENPAGCPQTHSLDEGKNICIRRIKEKDGGASAASPIIIPTGLKQPCGIINETGLFSIGQPDSLQKRHLFW